MPDEVTPGASAGQGTDSAATTGAAAGGQTTAPEAPAAPAAPAGGAPFYGSFSDESLKTWAEGKGWKSAEAAVKSAFHLEKMVGAPADSVLRIPQQGDVEGWKAAYQKLGAPTEASGYEIPGASEENAAFTKHLQETFLKAGLSQEQARTLVESSAEYNKTASEAAVEEAKLEVQNEDNELRKEWGNGYETQSAIATQAAQKLGFTEGMLDGIESAIGYRETMKFMAELGAKLGEDQFVSGETRGELSGNSTPAQAKMAWETFKADPNMMAALTDKRNPGHAAAMAKKADIFAVMYPNQ